MSTTNTPMTAAVQLLESIRIGETTDRNDRWELAETAVDCSDVKATADKIRGLCDVHGSTLAKAFRDGATTVVGIEKGLDLYILPYVEDDEDALLAADAAHNAYRVAVYAHCKQYAVTAWQKLGQANIVGWVESGEILSLDPVEVRQWWEAVRKSEGASGDKPAESTDVSFQASGSPTEELISLDAQLTDALPIVLAIAERHPEFATDPSAAMLEVTTALFDLMVDSVTV